MRSPVSVARATGLVLGIIIVAGLALRFVNLDAGLWEKHGWRQSDGAMIARNFYESGFRLFYPQIDWAGDGPGYVGTGFPLVPFLTALLYLPFGEHLALGRLVSIGFFIPTMVFFYLLVRRYFGRTSASFALFFYVFSPMCIYYTRALMPESALLCFSIGAIYFFSQWLDRSTSRYYLLTLLCLTCALLVKIPSAVIGLPIFYLAWTRHGWQLLRQPKLWILAVASFAPAVLWYRHAFALAAANYPFHIFGEGLWIWDGGLTALVEPYIYWRLLLVVATLLLTPVGLILALGGVTITTKRRCGTRLLHVWAIALLVHLVLALRGFYYHEYYFLPFLPVGAAFAGIFSAHVLRTAQARFGRLTGRAWLLVSIALAALVLAPALVLVSTRYETTQGLALYRAGSEVKALTQPEALVVAWDWSSPVLLYTADRRGWHFPEYAQAFIEKPGRRVNEVSEGQWPAILEGLRQSGADFFAAPRKVGGSDRSSSWVAPAARSIVRPVSTAAYLETHEVLDSHLKRCYREVLGTEYAIIYDLRLQEPGCAASGGGRS